MFRRIYTPILAWHIRRKKKIRVLFVLQYLSQWKTEALYLAMLNHPRFEPILGITRCIEIYGEEKKVITYCEAKRYRYVWLDPEKTLRVQQHPDIIIHQKLYEKAILPKHQIKTNIDSLFIYIPYALNNIVATWFINSVLTHFSWQYYFENKSTSDELEKFHYTQGDNFVVTGLPLMDTLLKPKAFFSNPWPNNNDKRKRIIYAPHHTISDNHLANIDYSTFLENGEFMLQMAEKYKQQAYFVFKPHPRLYKNLVEYWGQEKTDAYYHRWNNPGVSHIEDGEYIGLFKHSDAMIHDCGSFILEYMYSGNPVMYLVKKTRSMDNMTNFAQKAYGLHYKGKNHQDIEQFIKDVIAGNDPLKEQRTQFVATDLTPPHGKSACQNIINSILGQEEYS